MITILVALLFSIIGYKSKIPAGVLIGSIVGTALLNTATSLASFPPNLKVIATAMVGTYIGCKVQKSDLPSLRRIFKPAVAMAAIMLAYNLGTSVILTHVTGIDLSSCILSLAPAGVSDMSIVAVELGVNPILVSTAQMLRLVTVICCTPFLVRGVLGFWARRGLEEQDLFEPHFELRECPTKASDKRSIILKNGNVLFTLALGVSAGIIGRMSGLPAAALWLPMAVIISVNLSVIQCSMPMILRRGAQMFSGILIGMRFSLGDVVQIKESIIPFGLVILGWIILNTLLGFLIHKWTKVPMITALFASSAGGLTDMGIIASEMGGNSVVMTAFHLARMLSVFIFYPILVQLIIDLGWNF